MFTADLSQLADEAYKKALQLYAENHADKLTANDRTYLKSAVLRLIEDGMTDTDLIASYSINRASLPRR